MKTETTAIKILRIEEEYNSPFSSVVKSFADAGHSILDTGTQLGIGTNAFRRTLKVMEWDRWFVKGSESIGFRNAPRTVTPENLEKARKALKEKHSYWLDGVYGTTTDHATRLKVNPSTLRRRRLNCKQAV